VCGWPGLWHLSPGRGSEGRACMWLMVRGLTGEESNKTSEPVVVAPSNALNGLAGYSGLTQPCDTAPGPFPASHRSPGITLPGLAQGWGLDWELVETAARRGLLRQGTLSLCVLSEKEMGVQGCSLLSLLVPSCCDTKRSLCRRVGASLQQVSFVQRILMEVLRGKC